MRGAPIPVAGVRSRFGARATVLLLALASGACIAVLGLDPLSEKAPAKAAAEGGLACLPDDLGEPGKPEGATPASLSTPPVFFAFNRLDLGIDTAQGRPGADLDRRVTTDVETSSCTPRDARDLGQFLEGARDADGGVDSAFNVLLGPVTSVITSMKPDLVNARLVHRRFGVALRVEHWNGTKNADGLIVSVFPALAQAVDGGVVPAPEGNFPWRGFEPSDRWMPDKRFVVSGGSAIRSSAAWVNDGRLVARFPLLTFSVRTSNDEPRPFDIVLSDAWITASLSPAVDGALPTLTGGSIVGRETIASLLDQLALLYVGDNYICRQKREVANYALEPGCKQADIRASHCDDGRGLPCDAISFGARFEAYAVLGLGPPWERSEADYQSVGREPPERRCPGIDGGYQCP